MKKIVFFTVIAFALAASVFGQSYTVESVKGRVVREPDGSKADVKVGDVLSADTIIQTAVGASVVLKDGDNTITIAANRKGKISDLAAALAASVSGSVSRVDTSAVSRTTGQVSTASARSSVAVKAPRAVNDDDDDDDDDELETK